MMNLLLGIFYNNFKFRLEKHVDSSLEKRSEYLLARFNEYGGKTKGYLNKKEMYQMFMIVHCLVTLKDQEVDKEEAEEELSKRKKSKLM